LAFADILREKIMKLRLAALGAALAFSTLAPGMAQASVIATLDSITPVGSDFKFSYSGQLQPDEGVVSGDMLVIVDFAGYVAGSVSSTLPNVTASVSNTLPGLLQTYPGLTDNPNIPDLVFTYTGPPFQTSGGPFPSIVSFSGLSALSTLGSMAVSFFSADSIKNADGLAGTTDYDDGLVGVPGVVPEPAAWALMIVGFLGVGMALRARKGTAAA
jgi:hypothetical protein